MTDAVLEVEGLTVDLPGSGDRSHAVEDLSFRVNAREIVCIVGESGSGKSVTAFTTMGLLPKVLKPSAGRVIFEGRDILRMRPRDHAKLRGNRMAMIFQEPMTSLNPCFTVGNQIEEVFKSHSKLSRSERRSRTLALLEEVHLPEVHRIYASYPHQLSGGQRQRIVIALALAMNPSLLIADEPTTALDVTTQAQILSLIRRLKERHGAGILFVTHDFDVVAEIADRVVVMQNGRIVEEGPASDILNRPQHPYTQQLIAAVPPRRAPDHIPLHEDVPVTLNVEGLATTFHIPRTLTTPARTVHAVQPASFALRRGETLGIVGESGSGKTTLVRSLIRLVEPDTGRILIEDTDFTALSGRELRRKRRLIQIVFQDPYGSLNPRRSIGDQLVSAPINAGTSKDRAWMMARDLIRIVRLDPEALTRYPSQFSGGQRQRICIARALMMEPEILIADEAVSALDVSVQREVLNLLKEVRDRMGLTLLFITHDLRVAAQISDRIAVMKGGAIVETGTARDILENSRNDYTRSLLASMPGKHWDVPDIAATQPF